MTPIAWLLAVGLLVADAEPQHEDWDWLDKHRSVAFESLMPVEPEPRTWVTYFSYRDLYQDVREAYFTIRSGDGSSSLPGAVVITPVDRSIQQQLLDLHMADRTATFETLLPRVKVQRRELSSGSCPAVNIALDTLGQLRFGMPQRDVIILHPTIHRIVVEFGAGSIDFSLSEDDHALARWAQRTLADLQRCPPGDEADER